MGISKIKINGVEHELQTTIANVTNLQDTIDTINEDITQKSSVQIIIWEDDD